MKKKLLTILVVFVLVAVLAAAAACSDDGMIRKNEERNMTQVTADVSFAGRAAQVDKLDLNATINQFVYQYYYYYQQGYMTAEDYQAVLKNIGKSYDQANESLAQTEAYTLKCIDKLYADILASGTAEQKAAAQAASTVGKSFSVADRIKEIESVLPLKDLVKARKAYNEDMQESFDEYKEAYENEIKSSNRSTTSVENIDKVNIVSEPAKKTYEVGESALNLNGLKVSVTYKDGTTVDLERSEYTVTGFKSEEATDKQEISVTFGSVSATFDIEIVKAKPSRPAMPKDEDEEEEDTELPELFEIELDKKIADAKTAGDTDAFKALKEAKRRLEKQMETNYRDYPYYYLTKLKTQAVSTVEEAIGKTASVTGADILEKYEKDLEDQKNALVLGTKKYSEAIDGTSQKTEIVHKDGKYFYVQHVLFKITDDLQAKYDAFKNEKTANADALEAYLNDMIDQVGVYVSNVEYDKDKKCEEEDCSCVACENYKGENPGVCEDPNCSCVKCPNKRFINEAFATEHNIAAQDVNENGTINVHAVINAMYADLGSVTNASSFADRKAIVEKFRKWIYMCNEDDGAFTAFTDGKVGYSLSMDESSYVKNFTALSRALAYGDAAEKAEWNVVGEGVGSYGYCYTEYGIHVIMLTGYAFDKDSARDLGDGYYAVPANAVTDIWDYKAATESNELDEGTLESYLKDALLEEKKNDLTGAFKKEFYQNEMKEDAKISYHKVYKDLIKAYEK